MWHLTIVQWPHWVIRPTPKTSLYSSVKHNEAAFMFHTRGPFSRPAELTTATQFCMARRQQSFVGCRWCWMLPSIWSSVLASISTSRQSFVMCFTGCQYASGYYIILTRCLTLLEVLEIYWNNFSLLQVLEIYWKLAKSPGNFLADSKFLYFTV